MKAEDINILFWIVTIALAVIYSAVDIFVKAVVDKIKKKSNFLGLQLGLENEYKLKKIFSIYRTTNQKTLDSVKQEVSSLELAYANTNR